MSGRAGQDLVGVLRIGREKRVKDAQVARETGRQQFRNCVLIGPVGLFELAPREVSLRT